MTKGAEITKSDAEQVRDLAKSIGIPVGLVEAEQMEATNESILAELLAAGMQGGLDAVLGAGTVESLEDFAGRTLRFESVKWLPSTFQNEDGLDLPYAIVSATESLAVPGETPGSVVRVEKRHTISCGASKVVIALGFAKRDNRFPFEAVVIRNETSQGRRVLSLAAAE